MPILAKGDATATHIVKEPTKDDPETFVVQLVANHKEVVAVHIACILLRGYAMEHTRGLMRRSFIRMRVQKGEGPRVCH